MDKEYYKEYYHLERKHWWFKARGRILEEQVRKAIRKQNEVKILNIGVATGATTEMLSKYGEVTSIEYDKDCCNFLQQELGLEVIQGSITELPFPANSYDLVCAFDVIEHVEEDLAGVNEMKRVCKPQGNVLVTVPAWMSLWSEHDEINHHFRRYILKDLIALFNQDKSGEITFVSYFNFIFFFPVFILRKLANILSSRKKKKKQSDFARFNFPAVNSLLYKIFYAENLLLKRNVKLPIGVSLFLSWRKTKD